MQNLICLTWEPGLVLGKITGSSRCYWLLFLLLKINVSFGRNKQTFEV